MHGQKKGLQVSSLYPGNLFVQLSSEEVFKYFHTAGKGGESICLSAFLYVNIDVFLCKKTVSVLNVPVAIVYLPMCINLRAIKCMHVMLCAVLYVCLNVCVAHDDMHWTWSGPPSSSSEESGELHDSSVSGSAPSRRALCGRRFLMCLIKNHSS